ncbi:MAG TPA: hypothetical protein VFZ25_15870 [Chloroflexota bacterium]|nr:hypothetical protein [Chloroflexota bacterium]
MPRKITKADELVERTLAQLGQLRANDPAAATDFAIALTAKERQHRLLEPALEVLAADPVERARPALRARFLDLTENGVRFDQDCELRVRLARVLRQIGEADDADLAELGIRTIQLQPPARIDVAQPLRAGCLVWYAELEPERADYYAVELLSDPHASEFSGEPAVSAIRVLAARGHVLPIWALARRRGLQPDALAQAFGSLRKSPADLQLLALREHLAWAREAGESGEGVALVAAEAISLNGLTDGNAEVVELIRQSPNRNLCLYLVTAAARHGDAELKARLAALRPSVEPWRQDLLDQVLS